MFVMFNSEEGACRGQGTQGSQETPGRPGSPTPVSPWVPCPLFSPFFFNGIIVHRPSLKTCLILSSLNDVKTVLGMGHRGHQGA